MRELDLSIRNSVLSVVKLEYFDQLQLTGIQVGKKNQNAVAKPLKKGGVIIIKENFE